MKVYAWAWMFFCRTELRFGKLASFPFPMNQILRSLPSPINKHLPLTDPGNPVPSEHDLLHSVSRCSLAARMIANTLWYKVLNASPPTTGEYGVYYELESSPSHQ